MKTKFVSETATAAVATGTSITLEQLLRLRRRSLLPGFVGRKKVLTVLAGGYASPFRGRGMDFDEARVYQPGDDIRAMDWRVTARTGIAHTKIFRDERERPVYLLVDQGASMAFGTRRVFKSVAAAEAAATLAWAAEDNGDRVGAVIFSARGHAELRPARGRRGAVRLMQLLVEAQGTPQSSMPSDNDLLRALERIRRVARPGSLVFVVSDFRQFDADTERHLAQVARHNDVVAVFVYDALEAELPPPGDYMISDGERIAVLNTGNRQVIQGYRDRFARRRTKLESFCRSQRIHFLSLGTHQDVAETLQSGLLRQARMERTR